jgi:hypothetical protein
MDESDIVSWYELDLNVAGSAYSMDEENWAEKRYGDGDGIPCGDWKTSTEYLCWPYGAMGLSKDNGNRCGEFVEWQEGDPYSKNAETKEYTEKFGYWKSDTCCKKKLDSNGEETSVCESYMNSDGSLRPGQDHIDAEKLAAAKDVKLYHIVTVAHETGWQMGNLRGGILNEGDTNAEIEAGFFVGEYMLGVSDGWGNGNTSMSNIRNPFREGSMGGGGRYPRDNVPQIEGGGAGNGIERHFHPWWLNIVKKLNAAVDAGYGGTKIPIKDQNDYPTVTTSDGEKPWVSLMEESGVALKDSIQTHTYEVSVVTAGSELQNPNAGLGTMVTPHPNIKKKTNTVILSPEQEEHGKAKDPGDPNSKWGTFNTQQTVHLAKSSWEIKDSKYEIVDPVAYDHGTEYDILTDANGKDVGITNPTAGMDIDQDSPSRSEAGSFGPHKIACSHHCEQWDRLNYKHYTECFDACSDQKEFKCTTQRFLDTSSYLFEPANFFNAGNGKGWNLGNSFRKIWHPDFAKVENMMQMRGLASPRGNWLEESENHGADALELYNGDTVAVGDYRVFARFVKNRPIEARHADGAAGGRSLGGAGLLKRIHMLIHPWHFGLVDDQVNLLGEADNLPRQNLQGPYGPVPDAADQYLAVRRQSSVGYRKGVQPNLYNSFTLPPYKTNAGQLGAGDKTFWDKNGASIDSTPVEGYADPWDMTDPGSSAVAKKVYWVSAPDVQTRAKELGFHFEFRRLGVPYKMKEVSFSHSSTPASFYRESGNYHYLDHPWHANYDNDHLSPFPEEGESNRATALVGTKNSLSYCQDASKAGTEDGYYEPQDGVDWRAYDRFGCGLRDSQGNLLDTSYSDTVGKADHADLILQGAGREAGGNQYGVSKKWPNIINEAGDHPNANDITPDTSAGKEFADFRVQLGKPNKSHMSWWGDYTTHSKIYKLGTFNNLDKDGDFTKNDSKPCPFYGKTLPADDSYSSNGANGLNLWQLTLEQMTPDDITDREDYCKLAFHEEAWTDHGHKHGDNIDVVYHKPLHACQLSAGWWAEYDRRFGESSPSSHRSNLRTHVWGKDHPNAADEESRKYPFNVGAGASIKKELAERMASVSLAETCSVKTEGNNVCSHVLDQTPPQSERSYDLLVERGDSFNGTFEFDAKGYIPHVKKSYIFTTAQNAGETEWIRPIGHSTVRHISQGFSNYDLFTTDYVKKQKTFSCEVYSSGDWGKKWTRNTSCDPHRFENIRLDNDSMQWSGNMINHITSLPSNTISEIDSLPPFWGFDVVSKRIWMGPDNKHEKGVVYDNTRLLTDNPLLWTVAARKAAGFGTKKLADWTTKLPIVTQAVAHKTENAIKDNDHEGRYQVVSDPEADGAVEGVDYIRVAGIPMPQTDLLLMGETPDIKTEGNYDSNKRAGLGAWEFSDSKIWFDAINFYGGSESEPGFADMRRGGGFAFIGGETRNTNKTEKNNYGIEVSPYKPGLQHSFTFTTPRSNTSVFGAFAACETVGPQESGDNGSPPYVACPDSDMEKQMPDCVINNYFQPVYGDGGYNQFDSPNPGQTCTLWSTELVECITETQTTGCFFGSIDDSIDDGGPKGQRIGCYGGDGTDATVNVPVPITAQLINGYSVMPRVKAGGGYVADNYFYMTTSACTTEKDNTESVNYDGNLYVFHDGRKGSAAGVCDPSSKAGFNIGTTSWGEEGVNRDKPYNTYPWSAANEVKMGSDATIYNINWYDMIDHYSQGAILSVTADNDYKKEMLKLIDNRNPDALLYQDYTDFYAPHQFNKLFRYEEKDFVYNGQANSAGKALSSLVPYFEFSPSVWGTTEGVGQDKYMINTFQGLEGEHFGGRSVQSQSAGKGETTTILKTQSMPLADSDFIIKYLTGSFEGSLASLSGSDSKPLGLCSNCGGTDYWIGNSAATSAVNFYIENMIDLSPEAESLGGIETSTWGGPDLTPVDPDPVTVPS